MRGPASNPLNRLTDRLIEKSIFFHSIPLRSSLLLRILFSPRKGTAIFTPSREKVPEDHDR